MAAKRALVDCAVLSLQDSCVLYPSCKHCCSRVDPEQRDNTRFKCSRCGFSCLKEQVDYRYRLSLRVARESNIFGVTVFGKCLESFFGINANGIQRLLEDFADPVEASTRSALLVQAVEECFIGKHFIFGLKIINTGNGPLFGSPVLRGSTGSGSQFIASQIILPEALARGGCSVLSFYQTLLQKAAECPLESTGPRTALTVAGTPPVLALNQPANSSVKNSTPPRFCHFTHSIQRLLQNDSSLSPTPPGEQSLGLVTSSAEQEQGCSTQDSGYELNDRQTHIPPSPHGAPTEQRTHLEITLSPLPSFNESNAGSNYWFTYSPRSSSKEAHKLTPVACSRPSSSQLSHRDAERFSVRGHDAEQANTPLSNSLSWEDMPFSESLDVFLCKENQFEGNTPCTKASFGHLKKNLSTESVSRCQSNTQLSASHSHRKILLDMSKSNTSFVSHGDDIAPESMDRIYKDPSGCEIQSQGCNGCSSRFPLKTREGGCGEQLELCEGEDIYDCSADLFSISPMASMPSQTLRTGTETGRIRMMPMTNENTQTLDKSMDQCWDSNMSAHLAFAANKQGTCVRNQGTEVDHRGSSQHFSTQDQNRNHRATIDILHSGYSHALEFIPPSQSTPLAKAAPERSCASAHVTNALKESNIRLTTLIYGRQYAHLYHTGTPSRGSNSPDKFPPSLAKSNCHSANFMHQNPVYSVTPRRHSHKLTSRRRFRKVGEPKGCSAMRYGLRLGMERPLDHTCITDACASETQLMIPPRSTETLLPASSRRCGQTACCLGQTLPQIRPEQKQAENPPNQPVHCDRPGSTPADEAGLDKSQTFNCSRDLFTDSF